MATAKIRTLGALILSAMITSCGGDDDGELLTGVFSDSPVAGLSYVTPTTRGVTDADGLFNYREGETVVFSIGSLALPVVVASEMVTPLDMAAANSVTDPSVLNIARLLQSLDEDGNPENGISIPDIAADSFPETAIFDATDEAAVDAVVKQLYGDDRQTVSADQAVAHFVDSLSAAAGSDGSLEQLQYIVPVGASFEGENLFVDDQNFSLFVDGETHTGTATVKHGVYELAGSEDHWFVSVREGVVTKLACIASAPEAVDDCTGDLYRVFNEEQAAVDFSAAEDSFRADSQDTSESTSDLTTGAATDEADAAGAPSTDAVQTGEQVTAELTLEELFPECDAGTVDTDGDGFGWQDNQSCLIVVGGVVVAEQVNAAEQSSVPEVIVPVSVPESEVQAPTEPEPVVQAPVVTDPVAVSPEPEAIEVPEVIETPEAIEVPEVIETPEVIEVPEAIQVPDPVVTVQAEDITDIIVLTGQANAAAIETAYDASLDAGNERLFAFNEDGQWRTADLNQYWDVNLPANFSSAAEGRAPYNNLAFQIGKSLTEKTDRVVGIIMITASGEGISHWDYNTPFYQQIRTKVNAALALLPQKTSVDAMIWMQGETDWLAEGTADPGATGFASTDSDFYRNYYPNKLDQLIGNLRSESWYGFDAQFVCGETKKTDVNQHLMGLNDDGDALTSCAAASDLPTRESDPFGNHYSADGLRTLGDRIAELYISGAQ